MTRNAMRNFRVLLWGAVLATGIWASWFFLLGPGAGPGRPPEAGIALGRGDYQLTTTTGEAFTQNSLVGQPSLVFFGFTHCPDVCPTTLGELSVLLDDLGPQGDDLQVLLISGDPERDTPERLNEYLQSFDPRIVGLTGSEEEIEEAFSAFKAYRAIVPLENGDYTVDHSAGAYLFDREGGFFGILDSHEAKEIQRQKIERLLAT